MVVDHNPLHQCPVDTWVRTRGGFGCEFGLIAFKIAGFDNLGRLGECVDTRASSFDDYSA